MIERDYIMRTITMLTAVIARVLALKEAREFPRALDELQRQSRSLLGIDTDALSSLDASSLSHLFGSDPHTAGVKCYVAGLLLNERSGVLALMERADEAAADRVSALELLLEAHRITDGAVDARHEDLIEEIAAGLPVLPDPVRDRLRAYRERVSPITSDED